MLELSLDALREAISDADFGLGPGARVAGEICVRFRRGICVKFLFGENS
jgi:hypothetical protein